MYGLIGRIQTRPGRRAELTALLTGGTDGMPGCLSYIVAEDPDDADALWVTEVWDSAESHRASLALPGVQDAIRIGKPMIETFTHRFETRPVGVHGPAGPTPAT